MSLYRKIRQKVISIYHVQLSLAILLMLIVALVLVVLSAERVTPVYGGCVVVSVLVHYFTLVAVMWMGAEALLMFQKLVLVFTSITKKFIVIVSMICWSKWQSHSKVAALIESHAYAHLLFAALPIVLVVIPLVVDMANGHDPDKDIVVKRANTTDETSL